MVYDCIATCETIPVRTACGNRTWYSYARRMNDAGRHQGRRSSKEAHLIVASAVFGNDPSYQSNESI